MRQAAALLALGWLALVLQGAAATGIDPAWCPDLALLVVIGLGLSWERAASGLVLAAVLGFATDLLSGSILGQHALLRLGVFVAARLASRQLNLRGALPLAIFAAATSVVYSAAALAGTHLFAAPSATVTLAWLGDTLRHALVNAALAPAIASVVERVSAWTQSEEAGRRVLRLEARGPQA